MRVRQTWSGAACARMWMGRTAWCTVWLAAIVFGWWLGGGAAASEVGTVAQRVREIGGYPTAPLHVTQADLNAAWERAEEARRALDAAHGLERLAPDAPHPYTVQIAGFSTRMNAEEQSRNHNIRVAAQRLNGLLLPPGAILRFNEVVGRSTPEQGFSPALELYRSRGVMGIGGGVCQVSTTLFNAALLAGLTPLERHPHSVPVSYIPLGRDAMVADAGPDLVLQNTTGQTLRIEAWADERRLNIVVYGERVPEVRYSLETRQVSEVPVSAQVSPTEAQRGAGARVELHRIADTGHRELVAQSSYPPTSMRLPVQ